MSTEKVSKWAAVAGRTALVAFFILTAAVDAVTARGGLTRAAIILSVAV
ncbi:hypothetical protein ACFYQ5_28115 [Streptomyces sp. NPDC005794]